jgi:hypothetical protein
MRSPSSSTPPAYPLSGDVPPAARKGADIISDVGSEYSLCSTLDPPSSPLFTDHNPSIVPTTDAVLDAEFYRTGTYVEFTVRVPCFRGIFFSLPVIQIDHTSFRIDSFLFQRESDEARSFIQRAVVRDVDPDILPHDFACFLKVADCRYASLSDYVSHVDMPRSIWEDLTVLTKEEWTSVLALAHKLNFARIRALAIRSLRPIITPVDQLVLAREFGVDEWMAGARRALCEQEDWPTREDCQRLGVDVLFQIGRARQGLRAPGVLIPAPRREAVLASVFGEPDSAASANACAVSVEPGVSNSTPVSQGESGTPRSTGIFGVPPGPAVSQATRCTLWKSPSATNLHDTVGWFGARSSSAVAHRARAEHEPPVDAFLRYGVGSRGVPALKDMSFGGGDQDDDDVLEIEWVEGESEGAVDDTGVKAQDIELVMQQVRCSRAKAIKALKDSGGDLINASTCMRGRC